MQQFFPLLLTALNQGCNGYAFADGLINLYGRLAYDQVLERGKEKLVRSIKVIPDLWAPLAPIEARFDRFVDEFFDYDEEMRRQDEEDDEDIPVPAPETRKVRK